MTMTSRQWFGFWLAIWILSWPLSFLIALVVRNLEAPILLSNNLDVAATPWPLRVLDILSLLAGFYLFVGWIPLLMTHSRMQRS